MQHFHLIYSQRKDENLISYNIGPLKMCMYFLVGVFSFGI